MQSFSVKSSSRQQFINITSQVQSAVNDSGIKDGIVCVFVPHTTAGVTINENADPDVVSDLLHILDNLVPQRGSYRHIEGNSDSHAKSSLVGSSVMVIVEDGKLRLGTWQSIYFAEFDGPRTRQCWVKAIGK